MQKYEFDRLLARLFYYFEKKNSCAYQAPSHALSHFYKRKILCLWLQYGVKTTGKLPIDILTSHHRCSIQSVSNFRSVAIITTDTFLLQLFFYIDRSFACETIESILIQP